MPVASSTVRVTAANLVLGEPLVVGSSRTSHGRTGHTPIRKQSLIMSRAHYWDRPAQHYCPPSGLHVYCSLLPPIFTCCTLFRPSSFCIDSFGARLSMLPTVTFLVSVFFQCLFCLCDLDKIILLVMIGSQVEVRGTPGVLEEAAGCPPAKK